MEWFILLFQPCLSRILKTESEYIDSLYTEGKLASAGLGSMRKVWLSHRYTKSSGVTYVCRATRSVPAAETVLPTAPRGYRETLCWNPGCCSHSAPDKVGAPAQECLEAPLATARAQRSLKTPQRTNGERSCCPSWWRDFHWELSF